MTYYYLYKITNNINQMIYVGAHKTNNLDDGYMGSGKYIKEDIEKYGVQNFTKEILGFYDSLETLYNAESIIVNKEFIERLDTYNASIGGLSFSWKSMKNRVVVKDSKNNTFSVLKTDPRYLSGELVGIKKNKITTKDKDGNKFYVYKNDDRILSGELVPITSWRNKITVKDKNNKYFQVDKTDPRYLSGELIHTTSNLVVVKDKDGNTMSVDKSDLRYLSGELVGVTKGQILVKFANNLEGKPFYVSKDDPRWLSGELVGATKGKAASEASKEKKRNKIVVKDKDGNKFYIDKTDPRYLSGELVSVNKGKKSPSTKIKKCEICGKEIGARGFGAHMNMHNKKKSK